MENRLSKHHSNVGYQILHDVQTMTSDVLEEQYGIEIDPDDGTVWDPCEYKSFDDIHEWATFMQEIEDGAKAPSSSKISKYRYIDD